MSGTLLAPPHAPAAPSRPEPHRGAWSRIRERIIGTGFVVPAFILVAVMLLAPFAVTVYRSFLRDDVGESFAGLANYELFFTDQAIIRSVVNTLMWVVGSLVIPLVLGLAIAMLTNASGWRRWARVAIVIPYALSGAGVAVVWNFILRSDGALNQVLSWFGMSDTTTGWLVDWPKNTIVMIIASSWQGVGVAVILFLVGLQTVPVETVEAASLDGAGGWAKFRHIIFPQLKPVTIVVVGLSLVNGLKSFDLIWILTQGGPARASETLALSMYQETFLYERPNAGAAIAVVLTVIVLVASWIYLRQQLRPEGSR